MDISRIPSPAFVLEEEKLRENLILMQRVQKEAGISIILALKGFAMWSTFPMIKEYLKGATASSVHEARLCMEEIGKKAHTYCVAYPPNSFKEILQYSSHITFNSISEFHRYASQLDQHSEKVSIGIRVNPGFSNVETELNNPCAPGSRLGETSESLPDVLPEEIEGLHFHALSESNPDKLGKVLAAFEQRFAKYLPQLKWVNFGGGHLMTRKGYNVDQLISILRAFKKRYEVDIILEPGSAVAWNAGVLIVSVLDVFRRDGIPTAILDISFSAHLPDTLEMPYRPRIKGARDPQKEDEFVYRLGGISCLAGDFMFEYAFEKELVPGDKLVFEDMIHYTMVKTSMFNGLEHPQIGIWKENQSYQTIRTFGYEDYKGRLS
ncbi:MAG: carboxynorspermidine decarboxylase [Bacteroidota bacterium]